MQANVFEVIFPKQAKTSVYIKGEWDKRQFYNGDVSTSENISIQKSHKTTGKIYQNISKSKFFFQNLEANFLSVNFVCKNSVSMYLRKMSEFLSSKIPINLPYPIPLSPASQ